MNKFYEKQGYSFGYGSFLLLSYVSCLSGDMYEIIRQAVAEGYGYIVAKKENECIFLGWIYQEENRSSLACRHLSAGDEALREYPQEERFLLTISRGNLEVIPAGALTDVRRISEEELLQAIVLFSRHEVCIEKSGKAPIANLKVRRYY